MVLYSLVASHQHVDLETIARLSTHVSQAADTLAQHGWVNGVIPLATCNRLELYVDVEREADIPKTTHIAMAQLAGATELPEFTVRQAFEHKDMDDVAVHLFAVSAGLDSAVVGEREIAGQVRKALSSAQAHQRSSKSLVSLFQEASRTAKAVGKQTSLGERGRSIVSVALDLSQDVSDTPWSQRSALIIGTGAYAGATVALLKERGVERIQIFSPSGRASDFAAKRSLNAVAADDFAEALAQADLIIGCSGGEFQLSQDQLIAARSNGATGSDFAPVTIIDLALSHDIDPAVADLAGVELLSLESVRMAAPEEQQGVLEQAQDIVNSAAEKFGADTATRGEVDSAIVALREHTMAVLDQEMAKVRAQHGCTAATEEVEFALRRMMRQFLHIPTVRARELAAEGKSEDYVQALKTLFDIELAQTLPEQSSHTLQSSLGSEDLSA